VSRKDVVNLPTPEESLSLLRERPDQAEADVVYLSRVIGHSDTSTTLDIDSHLFDFDRQAADLRKKLAARGTARLQRRRELSQPGLSNRASHADDPTSGNRLG
jgi:hypothetical protein